MDDNNINWNVWFFVIAMTFAVFVLLAYFAYFWWVIAGVLLSIDSISNTGITQGGVFALLIVFLLILDGYSRKIK